MTPGTRKILHHGRWRVRGGQLMAVLAAAIAAMPAVGAPPAPISWTTHDVDKVADSATASVMARMLTRNEKAGLLIYLARILESVGDTPRARDAVLRAGPLLAPPDGFSDTITLGGNVAELARYGDTADAERLARGYSDALTQAAFVGWIGAGRASAGDLAAARGAAAALSALPRRLSPTTISVVGYDGGDDAIAQIAGGLIEGGLPEDAVQMVGSLPDGLRKDVVIAEAAQKICTSGAGNSGAIQHGRSWAAQAAAAFGSWGPKDVTLINDTFEDQRETFAGAVGVALAMCAGADAARAMVRRDISGPAGPEILQDIAEDLARDGKLELAQAIAPVPDPHDTELVLSVVQWRWKLGDHAGARKLLLAGQKLTGEAYRFLYYDRMVGAFDAAVSLVRAENGGTNGIELAGIVADEAAQKDKAALRATLPMAFQMERTTPVQNISYVVGPMTQGLARAGYLGDARQAYAIGEAVVKNSKNLDEQAAHGAEFLALQATIGDAQAALAEAERAGSMGVPRNSEAARTAAKMDCYVPRSPTMRGIVLQAPEGHAPDNRALVAGPQAIMLGCIADSLSQSGNIAGAMKVESLLEAEPRDAVREARGAALDAIAKARLTAGDPRAAYAIAPRIEDLAMRTDLLLALAAVKPAE